MCKSCERTLAGLPPGLLANLQESADHVETEILIGNLWAEGAKPSAAMIAGYLTATTGKDPNLAVMEFYRGLQIGRAKICKV